MCRCTAPVNAPFSWPNSSDSISSGGTAAQFSVTNGPSAARTFLVQRARRQLLAGPGFAVDADAGLAGGDALHLGHHAAHGVAGPDDLMLADALAQLAVLVLQPLQLKRVLHRQQKLVRRDRLLQKIDRTQARRPHRHLDVRLSGHHHHGSRDAVGTQVFQQRQTVAAGHHHVDRMRSKGRPFASSSALAALSQTVASCPARRNARDSDARVLASSSTIRMSALLLIALGHPCRQRWQLNHERRSAARLRSRRRIVPVVIAHHRLHDGEAQSSAMLLSGVVGREQPLALFRRHPAPVSDTQISSESSFARTRRHRQRAAIGHGVHGVQHEVRQRTMQQFRVGREWAAVIRADRRSQQSICCARSRAGHTA